MPRQVAAAIGDSLEAVCSMQEQERSQLIAVLGLDTAARAAKRPAAASAKVATTSSKIVKTEEAEVILDSDDEPLHENHDNDHIFVSSDEELNEVIAKTAGGVAVVKEEERGREEEEEEEVNTGWGECPMCTQLFRIPELRLHCMACEVLHLHLHTFINVRAYAHCVQGILSPAGDFEPCRGFCSLPFMV